MLAVKVDFDDRALKSFSAGLSVSALERAAKRAVRKTALWVRTQLLRYLRDDGIRRKIIVHRVKLYDKAWRTGGGSGPAVKVWFGVNAVNADELGRPVKTASGYRVRSWQFDAAFMPGINPRYRGKLYQRTSRHRLPIQRAKVEVDEMANDAFALIVHQIPGRLRELMAQELRYEVEKVR